MPKNSKNQIPGCRFSIEELDPSDPAFEQQVYHLLVAFAQIEDGELRENIIARAEWMARHPDVARKYLEIVSEPARRGANSTN